MEKPSLDSAYALVNRAGEHLNQLKILHEELVAAQAKATIFDQLDFHIPPGEHGAVANVEVKEHVPVPDSVRILVGEIANNLRSALNYLIARLSELDCGVKRKSDRLQFPIEAVKERFVGQQKSNLAGLSVVHVAAIERLQPYNGCEWTGPLQRLSNLHKHDDLLRIINTFDFGFVAKSTEANPSVFAMDMKLRPSFTIALGDGLPVVQTLQVLQSQVAQTLDVFKPEFEIAKP
jgi:hypothetical protein